MTEMCVNVCVGEKWEGETGLPGPAKGGGLGVAQTPFSQGGVETEERLYFTTL